MGPSERAARVAVIRMSDVEILLGVGLAVLYLAGMVAWAVLTTTAPGGQSW